jgi:hypothetical protein
VRLETARLRSAVGLRSLIALLAITASLSSATTPVADHLARTRSTIPVNGAGPAVGQFIDQPIDILSVVRDTCPNVRAHIAQDALHGIYLVTCITYARQASTSAIPLLCQFNSQHVLRFDDCYDNSWKFLIFNTRKPKEVGKVAGTTIFWNTLSYKSLTWSEHILVPTTRPGPSMPARTRKSAAFSAASSQESNSRRRSLLRGDQELDASVGS